MFEFVKVVSDKVLDTTNAVYHDQLLICNRDIFRKKFVSHHRAVNEVDSCLLVWYKELEAETFWHFIGCCMDRKYET